MQTISFAEGNEQYLKDCKDALCRSVLYNVPVELDQQ